MGPADDGEASAPREMDGDEYGLEIIFPIVFDEKRDEVAGCDTAVGRDGIRDGSFDLGDSVVYYSRQVRRIENALGTKKKTMIHLEFRSCHLLQ